MTLLIQSLEPSMAKSNGSLTPNLGLILSILVHVALGIWIIQANQAPDKPTLPSGTLITVKLSKIAAPASIAEAAPPTSSITSQQTARMDKIEKNPPVDSKNNPVSKKQLASDPSTLLSEASTIEPKPSVIKKMGDKKIVDHQERAATSPSKKVVAPLLLEPKIEPVENPANTSPSTKSLEQKTSDLGGRPSDQPFDSYENRPLLDPAHWVEKSYPPNYPDRSIELNQEGTVLIRVLLTEDGESIEFRLWRSSGFALLDNAALSAIRKWRFKPAEINGQKATAWVQIPVNFKLN